MRRLNDVKWEDIKEGDFVVSATGRIGNVVGLHPFHRDDESLSDMSEISMKWQYIANPSRVAHKLLKKVIWFGDDEQSARSLVDQMSGQ